MGLTLVNLIDKLNKVLALVGGVIFPSTVCEFRR